MEHYDAIVVGVGGMGAAVTDALARRGVRVLALEQFEPGHTRGSSHGQTRIIRQAYFESPAYIPLLRRTYELWDAMPAGYGIRRVGCLLLGGPDYPAVRGALRSAQEWDIPVQALTAAEVVARFPAFAPGADDVGVFEPGAGFVRPEPAIAYLTSRASAHGAQVRPQTPVLGWETRGDGVRVRTETETYAARRLVLTAGAWTPTLAAGLGLPIRVVRRVMHFFAPDEEPARFAPGTMPTFVWDLAVDDAIYGFPADGTDGVKIGFHHRGPVTDPATPQPPGSPAEIEEMRQVLARRLPGVSRRHVRSVGCMYALTPDRHFALGPAPGCGDRVVVAAGFSGHGFKFIPVVGEVVADLVTTGQTEFDLGFLSPARFGVTSVTPRLAYG